MKALRSDIDFKTRKILTVVGYFHILPLEKTKNGYYKCELFYDKNGEKKFFEWVIPSEYLEENGHFQSSKDVYFARWFVSETRNIAKDEAGKVIYDDDGNIKIESVYLLGRLVEFWNTRVFGVGSDKL